MQAQDNPVIMPNGTFNKIPKKIQRDTSVTGNKTNNARLKEKPSINLYKIISLSRDTTVVDTTLTIDKMYKFNYLRKDRFGLLPFANTGQTHNTLLYDFDYDYLKPKFGARARHFNYMEAQDINYYEVPTPLTELYFKSVFEQGQNIDAFFTINTSPRFNFSLAYKGLRSLGKYQHILTSTGNFRFTVNYRTANDRYKLRAHYVAQDLMNQENGGLDAQAILNFEEGEQEYDERAVLNVNFENAESVLDGGRLFLDHTYDLLEKIDSIPINQIQIGHRIQYESKFYEYTQTAPSSIFGNSFSSSSFSDKVELKEFENTLFVNYENKTLGRFNFNAGHTHYDYGYNTVLINTDNNRIVNRLQGDLIKVGAGYDKTIGDFNLNSKVEANISGDFDAFSLSVAANYKINADINFQAALKSNSRAANYNHLLYQSSYENYNWYNVTNYNNVKTNELNLSLQADKWVNIDLSAVNINDYAYFAVDPESNLVNSFQSAESVNYIKVKVKKEFKYGKFGLYNTIAYQQVDKATSVINVPEIITRNTLYYKDYWFKKAMLVQTGINLNYFTAYNMNAYDPVLAEFYIQDEQELGGFPLIDLFFNMKVRQTRIFFIAEHVNSPYSGNNFYSAPGYPYHDFNLRFGLVWNFFL